MVLFRQEVLDHGYVELLEVMGSDESIANSARVSYQSGTKSVRDNANLIAYLVRNGHTSPLEMAEMRFRLKLPIFIMRQLVRHRTANLNEVSARYSVLPGEFYVPGLSRMNPQSPTNKQGSGEDEIIDNAESMIDLWKAACNDAVAVYHELLSSGLSRELARSVLPVATYTECIWKCDLHNLIKFLSLRMDSHAQYEIRVFADAMYEAVKMFFPATANAFETHILHRTVFSEEEMNLLFGTIDMNTVEENTKDWSASKKAELMRKINGR